MSDHTATLLFVQLDDFARAAKAGSESEKWFFRLKARDKDRKLTLPEAACLLALFQLSTCRSLKAFLLFNGFSQQVSASTLRMVSGFSLDQVPISDHQPPTKFGDTPPRIMDDWGQQSCRTWLAKTLRIKVCI